MSDLTTRHCQPREGGVEPLGPDEAAILLAQLEGWSFNEDRTEIRRELRFGNCHDTIAFVNAVAWLARAEDHHPDLEVSHDRCLVRFSTHVIGALSRNDFICAAKVDALMRTAVRGAR